VDVFPPVVRMRAPFVLHPGASMRLHGEGYAARPGCPFKSALVVQTTRPNLEALTAIFELGAIRARVEGRPIGYTAEAETSPVVSMFEPIAGSFRGAEMPGAAGWLRVTITR
jgi:hypothetical protein